MIGRIISHYRILSQIGRGGMGIVYRAVDLKLDREVALKVLPPELVSDPERKRRFIQEAKAAAKLEHPHIGVVHEIDESEGVTFIAMELIQGEKLRDVLQQEKLPLTRTLRLATEVAEGLARAHDKGIVHRDLKPTNIMVTEDGHAKIIDFGLAKLVEPLQPLTSEAETLPRAETKSGIVLGTASYMSPEQARGAGVDHRSDIFSFGIVLYEMLSGELPFRGTGGVEVLSAILRDPAPKLPDMGSEVPEEAAADLQRIVDKCLAKEPAERYPTIKDVVTELRAADRLAELGSAPAVRPALGKGRRFWGAAVGAAILIVIASVGGWRLWERAYGPAESVSPDVVAVLPFSVRGSEEFTYLREGLVDLLGTTLNTETQRVVDPKTLLRQVEREGGEELDLKGAQRIAERFGAGRYVLGTVVESGGHLRIQSSLYDVTSGGEVLARVSVEGDGDDLFTMVDNLTSQLLVEAHPGPGSGAHIPRIGTMTTESLEALKAYLEGDTALRAGSMDLEKAYRSFQRAVELDPTFALAWYRLGYVGAFSWDKDPSFEYFQEALRLADRLSERDRLRVQASFNFVHGSPEESERLYKELLDKYPDDADAWALLSQVIGYFSWRVGRFYEDALRLSRECAERAQALDPNNFDAASTLQTLYAFLGRYDDVEHQRRILQETQGSLSTAVSAHLALVRGDERAWRQILHDMRDNRTILPHQLYFATWLPEHSDRVRELIEVLHLPESRSPEQRSGGHITLAIFAAARGRWSEAETELTAAEPLYPAAALEYRAILSLAPFVEVPRDDLVLVRDNLARLYAESARPTQDSEGESFPYPPGFRPVLRPYLLGLLSARLGEETTALRYAAELEQLPAPELMPSTPQDLAGSVRAHVALNDGKVEDALALLEQARLDAYPERWFSYATWAFTTLAYERFLRAELLHGLGRDQEALGWYNAFELVPSFAFAHLRIAEIREKQGNINEAIEHYDLFTRFWKDCDPELRPIVEEAKRRLEKLKNVDAG